MKIKNKNIFVWDGINSQLEEFDTIEKAKYFIKTEFCDSEDGIHPDIESVFIMERIIDTVVKELPSEKVGVFHEITFVDNIKVGKKTDLPPKGYVRITGVENKSDWNELVKLEDIKKRGEEIFSEYPDEDAYYTDLKYFWLLYKDGSEQQLSDIVWDKK